MIQNKNDHFETSISLKGGGQLADIDEIVSVKVDPGDIHQSIEDGHVTLSGEVRAYVYFTRAGSQTIEGEGLRIPFSRRIKTPTLKEPIQITIDDIKSDYDYDAATGHFEHEIELNMRLIDNEQVAKDVQAQDDVIREGPDLDDHPSESVSAKEPEPEETVESIAGTDGEADDSEPEVIVWKPFPPPIN